ncbi:Cd/Co/Hg/Pb/Zn-translocating P-type ATPase [Trichormus variabilis ATCC 29413]|uniref:Cd/Co/Hg/Pb/Zn-translocating P-type ATPase n=2 Tax=Anabaena variabilis TaxID=264691 RepID=Q3M2X5_TRIV2|nr:MULTISPECIES: heavy metal translocating P-type ATPase [Nostocaceae]ABA24661.1 Cd/Co/Hg/Pb/Zn-translocating P-type ATPase [Trichormus variabilis ATCC 29413]MBC1217221.1 cadmium-translocating P-type ATPase [Trichormus variabilis ARAD]MBC1257474.1 cadmium-translocating P-type ATPase [Trichormus variabilis V5]MBC1269902.1 cadmium-translocating P-type ATPase [Trichormus variabilis FSR]MBC1303528.1 cadmium-translocating P-type ATPase [Trichormus variabilis N2B]
MAKMTVQLASLPVKESYVTLEEKSGEVSITSLPYKIVGEQNSRVALTSAQVQSSKKTPHVTYSVVHAIQGRLRLRVPRLRNDKDYGQRLQTLLEADPLVTTVKIKPAAASLVVNYKASAVTDAKMRSRLGCLMIAASDPGIVLLNPKKVSPQEEEKPWPGMQLSVLATGLAVLGGPLGVAVPPIVTAGTIALATLPVFKRAVDGIVKERKLSIDFLDFIAIAITTVQGQFLTPSLMLSLIEIGENIRDRTARSSKMQTLDLLGSLGQFAWVERDGEKTQIPIQQVLPGDTVIVYPGEQIPIDGTILRGKALLDEQKLTGESVPILKKQGQSVFASTLVREGQVYILAERIGNDTRAGQSIKLMEEAPVHDTRMENHATRIAEIAVVPTLLLGAAVFAVTRNPVRVASILTLDLCTGIRVSIPTTVLAALSYAARQGILIRSGRALEQLAEIDTIVFDKTGTLTQGEVAVIGVDSYNPEVTHDRILAIAAAAEQRLTHPVAEAIVRYAEAQQVAIPSRSKWDYKLGLGVKAEIDGETVYVGSERFLRQEGVDMAALNGNGHKATSVIYVASNGQLQGKIRYSDILRPESREVISQLMTVEGVEVHMLTGDNKRTATTVAAELGIAPAHTHAEAFPEQKATVVRGLHEQGKTVAFVGDGINDSPALAYADVSVSFAHGSEIARETADVVLMQNDLHGLLEAIAIARQAKSLIRQNTGIVAIPNLGALLVAVLFGLNPLAATVVNNGSTIVAGVNGLRPILKQSPKKALPAER